MNSIFLGVNIINVALLAGIIGTVSQFAYFTQTYKIHKTKNTQGVSIATYCIFLLNILVWLVYGMVYNSPAIVIPNIVAAIGCLSVIIAYYINNVRRNDKKK